MRCNNVKIRRDLLLLHGAVFSLSLSAAGCGGGPSSQSPAPARWHNNQGVVYMDQHNYARGKEEFKKAIGLVPTYAVAHANLGIAYYSLGKYDSATVALQAALQHDADLLQAHYTLGLIYNAQGKEHEKALRALETVARVDPDDPHVLYYLGQVKAKLGQSEEAIQALHQAIRMDPFNVSAYYALANQFRRLDRREEWRQTLTTFNKLTQAGHQGISSSYQGQGMYAEAVTDVSGADPARDDARRVFRFAAPSPFPETPGTLRFATTLDYDSDGDADLLLGGDQLRLYRNDGASLSPAENIQLTLPQGFTPLHVTAADYDNDGDADLVLSGEQILLLAAEGAGRWSLSHALDGPARKTFVADGDHDGDLDLLIAADGKSRLWANDGSGQFADIADQAGLSGASSARQAIFSDYDSDRDIDFFVLGEGAVQLFTSNRDGTFAEVAASLGLEDVAAAAICVEDIAQDRYMDLCVLDPSGKLTLYVNQEGKQFAAASTCSVPLKAGRGLLPADLDNDGDLDLLAFGSGGIYLLAYRGDRFHLEEPELQSGSEVEQVLAADFDGDGLVDLWADGQLLRNETPGGNWIKITPQGLGSNRDGIGAKIEVKTANRLQKKEVRRSGQDFGVLTFGLAASDSVEFVRVLWPGGVRQTELATRAGQTLRLTELDRKGTSCPIVYAWDGENFRFVSDINGGAIIGYLLAPGEYNVTDTDEYIRLGDIAPRDGRYVIQFANHLEEIIYVDALHLVAVDHPVDVDVYPNERLLSSPPYPEFRVYPLRDLRPPRRARDHRGRDILAPLRAVDDEWYDDFGLTDIHGYAEDYSITLDLGDLSQNPHPVLLAYGWVDYAHSTSNWAATQRGLVLYPPRVEVPDGRGNWVEVCADMGTPAGLPKHMLFDLQGLFLTQDFRLRITTNTAAYWDQFLVGTAVDVPLSVHRLEPERSDLHWRGYPEHTAINGTFAFRYHYDRLRLEGPWGTHAGAFTRFGPVPELVRQVDDRYVIMFHGDELTVEFDATLLPPLGPDLERSFLLYSDSFGKDMDFHSAHSLTVEPLPFHGMSSYPYPAAESYPQDQAHLDYLLEYNTRRVKGYYQ